MNNTVGYTGQICRRIQSGLAINEDEIIQLAMKRRDLRELLYEATLSVQLLYGGALRFMGPPINEAEKR